MIMFHKQLNQSVEDFATLMLPLSEKVLEQGWIRKDHDEEGTRWARFMLLLLKPKE